MLVLLVGPLAACGGGSKTSASTQSARDAYRAALEKTTAAGTESVTIAATVQLGGQSASVDGSGAVSTSSSRGSLSLRVHAGPIETTVDEVDTGTAIFLHAPLFTPMLPGGKSWLKVDLAKLGGLQGLLASPSAYLGALQSPKTVTRIGPSEYRVEPSKGTGSYDVTVGADGYIHRVRLSQQDPKLSATIDLSNFGKAVVAPAPPPSKVYAFHGGTIPGLSGVSA